MLKKYLIGLILGLMTLVVWADEIPNLDLRTLSGGEAGLDQYVGKGKWVLVMFWATECPICERDKPGISAFHSKHKDKDAMVVGVAIDGMENIEAIKQNIETHKPGFPNLVASDLGVMAMNYQIAAEEEFRGTPTYWFFSPEGELSGVNPGPVRLEALESFMAKRTELP